MGCDIHWVAERIDQDGLWHAVMSKARAYQLDDNPEVFGLTKDQTKRTRAIGYRDYARFGVLSGIRYDYPGQYDTVADRGLPEDLSEASESYFDSDDLHSQGHFTLGEACRLVAQKNGNTMPNGEALEAGRKLIVDLQALAEDPTLLGEILSGPPYDEDGERPYPEMETSAHARLARIEAAGKLKPINGDTLRFLIAYDN